MGFRSLELNESFENLEESLIRLEHTGLKFSKLLDVLGELNLLVLVEGSSDLV